MKEYITDERTELNYELTGNYYIITGDDEPRRTEANRNMGQRHLFHLKNHRKVVYINLPANMILSAYLV